MALLTTKDLAVEMQLHVRTVKRWWKQLGHPPDACKRNGCHRWTPAGVANFLAAWRNHYRQRDTDPETVAQKAAGTFNPDKLQPLLQFDDSPKKNLQLQPGGMGKTLTPAKAGGDAPAVKARAEEASEGRAATA